jgi:hypothetical protein
MSVQLWHSKNWRRMAACDPQRTDVQFNYYFVQDWPENCHYKDVDWLCRTSDNKSFWRIAQSTKMWSSSNRIFLNCCWFSGKGKATLVLIQLSTMPWRGIGKSRYSSTILILGTGYISLVSFTILPLYPRGTSIRYQLYRKPDRPQTRSRCRGEENSFAPLRNRIPIAWSSSP